jgi:hypothetical protein
MSNEVIQAIQSQIEANIARVTDVSLFQEYFQRRICNSTDFDEWSSLYSRILVNLQTLTPEQKIQKKLQENIAFFRPEHNPTIFKDLEDSQKSVKLITGQVQSGKTAVICGLATYLIKVLKMPVVIVVRNFTADYIQLSKKFKSTGTFGEYDILCHYAKDGNKENFFSAENVGLTICLEHQTQLRKVLEGYHLRKTPFCLIADEADAVCYKTGSGSERERIGLFNELRDCASQFIAVTATAFDMLYLEKELVSQNIYHVPVPEFYKGIEHPDFTIEELPDKFDFISKAESSSIWTLSRDMELFYTRLTDTPVFESVIREEDEKYGEVWIDHPVICLQRTETVIAKQLQCMATMIRHPVFGQQWTVIVYNGEGVYAYSPDGMSNEIKDSDGNVCRGETPREAYLSDAPKALYFKSLTIGDILQYFKDCGIATHILIVAGQMVNRGLNICSNDYKWHLTHQILKLSDTATCADNNQISGRLFGIYRDPIPTRLFVCKKDALGLKQTHYLQKRIFEGASLHELAEKMPNLCEQIKVFVGLIPRRKTSKKCREPKWNKVFREQEQYGEVEEENKVEDVEDGQGWLVYRSSQIQKKAYEDIEKVLLEQGWTNMWVKRNEIESYLPDREWDRRKVTNMHNSVRVGETRIQYRKVDNRVEYKLTI